MNLTHKAKLLLARRAVRYIIVGGVCFMFEYGIFLGILYGFDTFVGLAQAASYVLALVVNFLLLRLWAFQTSEPGSTARQIVLYALLVCFNLPASSLLAEWLTIVGLSPFVVKVIVVGVVAVWNYVVYKKLIFRGNSGTIKDI